MSNELEKFTERLREFVRASVNLEHAATDGSCGDELRALDVIERAATALQDALGDVVRAGVEEGLREAARRHDY